MSKPLILVSVLMLALSLPAGAASIRSPEIIAGTAEASFACLQWRATGLCLWLDCGIFGCRVRTTLKVGHYNPDLVVSNYNTLGGNPWLEIRATLGIAQASAARSVLGALTGTVIGSAGNRTEGTDRHDHRNLIFRETDAIGHPGLNLAFPVLPASLRCVSQARPFTPYFLSGLDALAWRSTVPESLYPASLIPGLREVGSWPRSTWGSVYPRTGWSIQAEEPKAAALTAQRVGDIVTRRNQPHVYQPLTGPASSRQRVWAPGALVENDPDTGMWQMLAPVADRDCYVFGEDGLAMQSWANGRVDPEGDYVWNLWRPYECCQRRGQWFLGDINWTEYP